MGFNLAFKGLKSCNSRPTSECRCRFICEYSAPWGAFNIHLLKMCAVDWRDLIISHCFPYILTSALRGTAKVNVYKSSKLPLVIV